MSRHTKLWVLSVLFFAFAAALMPADSFAYEPPKEVELRDGEGPEGPPPPPDSGDADEILIRFAPPPAKGDLPYEQPREPRSVGFSQLISDWLQKLVTWVQVSR